MPPKLVSNEYIYRQLSHIAKDIEALQRQISAVPYEEFVSNEKECTEAERRFERIVNTAIHINLHIIRAKNYAVPKDYQSTFTELGSLYIIPQQLAKDIAPATGTRNILVHEYDDLDAAKFYQSLQKSVTIFPQYISAIQKYIDQL